MLVVLAGTGGRVSAGAGVAAGDGSAVSAALGVAVGAALAAAGSSGTIDKKGAGSAISTDVADAELPGRTNKKNAIAAPTSATAAPPISQRFMRCGFRNGMVAVRSEAVA